MPPHDYSMQNDVFKFLNCIIFEKSGIFLGAGVFITPVMKVVIPWRTQIDKIQIDSSRVRAEQFITETILQSHL
jgi:hypothetical protein